MRRCKWSAAGEIVFLALALAGAARGESSPAARRAALITAAGRGPAAIPQLKQALGDRNLVVRRTAARLLSELGKAAEKPLAGALQNEDVVVRRVALYALYDILGGKVADRLQAALKDSSPVVRQSAVEILVMLRPRTPQIDKLLAAAAKDSSDAIRRLAVRAQWPFHRQSISLRDREDYDHDVQVIQRIPLPKDGWRFKLDPNRRGHTLGWFHTDFDDSGWDTIAIEQAWQKAGYDYIGVTWYRRRIDLPAKPEHTAVDISFGGVDESAWVWVNGMYIGDHDIGPEGWNIPFRLDVTRELKWGRKNQITVRAMNTAHAGGIWKPVALEVLK